MRKSYNFSFIVSHGDRYGYQLLIIVTFIMDRLPPTRLVNTSPPLARVSHTCDSAINISPTTGLRASGNQPKFVPLYQRFITAISPANFISKFYNAFENSRGFSEAKAFISAFCTIPLNTLGEMYKDRDKAIPEVMKFLVGLVGFSAAVGQTAAALINGSDLITPLLKKAGVDVTGMRQQDLVTLASSLIAMQLGIKRDISIKNGHFKITYHDYAITVSNIELKNVRTVDSCLLGGEDNTVVSIAADELSLKLKVAAGNMEPSIINLRIPELVTTGETNLLSLVANAVESYYRSLPPIISILGSMDSNNSVASENQERVDNSWLDEKPAILGLEAKSLIINIDQAGELLEKFGCTNHTELVFTDIQASQDRMLIKDQANENPKVCFALAKLNTLESEFLSINSGHLLLDYDLNGEIFFVLKSNLFEMKKLCLKLLPKSLRNSISQEQATDCIAVVKLGAKINSGLIDLNTLEAQGLDRGGINHIQNLLQKFLINSLNSEHSRLKKVEGNQILKIHAPLLSNKKKLAPSINPPPVSPESSGSLLSMLMKQKSKLEKIKAGIHNKALNIGYSHYQEIPNNNILIPEDKGRGKISLLHLLKESINVDLL